MDNCSRGNECISQLKPMDLSTILFKKGPTSISDAFVNRIGCKTEKEFFNLAVLGVSRTSPDFRSRNDADAKRSLKRLQSLEGFGLTAQQPDEHIRIEQVFSHALSV